MLDIKINDTKFNQDVKTKIASRALIIQDNKIAVLYSKEYDFYVTPGGGVENDETLKEACIREAKEEAGLIVKPIKQFAKLECHYPRIKIIHNYFICELVETVDHRSLTEQELDQDLELQWMDLDEVRMAFSSYSPVVKYDAWMQREYLVVAELRDYLV